MKLQQKENMKYASFCSRYAEVLAMNSVNYLKYSDYLSNTTSIKFKLMKVGEEVT